MLGDECSNVTIVGRRARLRRRAGSLAAHGVDNGRRFDGRGVAEFVRAIGAGVTYANVHTTPQVRFAERSERLITTANAT